MVRSVRHSKLESTGKGPREASGADDFGGGSQLTRMNWELELELGNLELVS